MCRGEELVFKYSVHTNESALIEIAVIQHPYPISAGEFIILDRVQYEVKFIYHMYVKGEYKYTALYVE